MMHLVDELTDGGLKQVMTAYRRDIEDGVNVDQIEQWLAEARAVQLARFRLRMRLLALGTLVPRRTTATCGSTRPLATNWQPPLTITFTKPGSHQCSPGSPPRATIHA
jgi:hypothetical protein